jgi:hypothetical protein
MKRFHEWRSPCSLAAISEGRVGPVARHSCDGHTEGASVITIRVISKLVAYRGCGGKAAGVRNESAENTAAASVSAND